MIGEITKFIQSYNSKIEFNPGRLEEIRERLGRLSLLRKSMADPLTPSSPTGSALGLSFPLRRI